MTNLQRDRLGRLDQRWTRLHGGVFDTMTPAELINTRRAGAGRPETGVYANGGILDFPFEQTIFTAFPVSGFGESTST